MWQRAGRFLVRIGFVAAAALIAVGVLSRGGGGITAGTALGDPGPAPGTALNVALTGTPNDNLTLFSFTGQALPSVGLFQSPLAVCAHYDPMALPCEVPDGASAAPGARIGG